MALIVEFICELPNGVHARPASHVETLCNMLDWLMPSCFAICREETDCSSLTLACRKSAIFCSFSVNSLPALLIFVRYNIFHSPGLAA